jgi:hypothetical protein
MSYDTQQSIFFNVRGRIYVICFPEVQYLADTKKGKRIIVEEERPEEYQQSTPHQDNPDYRPRRDPFYDDLIIHWRCISD